MVFVEWAKDAACRSCQITDHVMVISLQPAGQIIGHSLWVCPACFMELLHKSTKLISDWANTPAEPYWGDPNQHTKTFWDVVQPAWEPGDQENTEKEESHGQGSESKRA